MKPSLPFVQTTFLMSKYTERKVNLKGIHLCQLGQLWKRKIYWPRGQTFCLSNWKMWHRQQQVNEETAQENSQMTKNALENISSELTCTSIYFWFFLKCFSVVFWTKYARCWAGNPKLWVRWASQTVKFITGWTRVDIWKHYFFETLLHWTRFLLRNQWLLGNTIVHLYMYKKVCYNLVTCALSSLQWSCFVSVFCQPNNFPPRKFLLRK